MNKMAIHFFGTYWRARRQKHPQLRDQLIKANMHQSLEEWLSTITLGSIIIAILSFPVFILASSFIFGHFFIIDTFRDMVTSFTETAPFRLLGELLLVTLLMVIPFLCMFLVFYMYPMIMIWERKRKIDAFLPYAIGWMSSLATVGIVPYEIFRKLSETEEYYGEVSHEARRMIRDVEVLGFDFSTALRNLSATTPSVRLRTFLQGAMTSTLSGGEMGGYFVSKAKENMEENRRKFSDFLQTLGMLSELYITGLVAGPLFIIVMFTAMMLMNGASPMILQILIYAIIPLGSFMFILLTDSMTPQGM